MRDNSDRYTIQKTEIFDLPMRLIICGSSGMGKTSLVGNMLLRDDFYRKDFEPENIFIFSGSLKGDHKLQTIIKELDIPQGNVFNGYNEAVLEHVYDELTDRYEEAINEKRKPDHSIIIFDDVSFSNAFAKSTKDSQIDRLFSNSRKFLVSICFLCQKYTQLNTCARENMSGLILGKSTNKQLDLIEQDLNFMNNKKDFLTMVKRETPDKHDVMVFTPHKDKIYRNKDFIAIDN